MVAGVKPYIDDDPKPLLTNSAIKLFGHLMKTCNVVVEFGAGNSTIWLAKRSSFLISVEHDPAWRDAVQNALDQRGLSTQVNLVLVEPHGFPGLIAPFANGAFDLVFVDCYSHVRGEVIQAARDKIKVGGWLVVDDPEQLVASKAIRRYLSDWGSVLITGKKRHPASGRLVPAQTAFFRKGMQALNILRRIDV